MVELDCSQQLEGTGRRLQSLRLHKMVTPHQPSSTSHSKGYPPRQLQLEHTSTTTRLTLKLERWKIVSIVTAEFRKWGKDVVIVKESEDSYQVVDSMFKGTLATSVGNQDTTEGRSNVGKGGAA